LGAPARTMNAAERSASRKSAESVRNMSFMKEPPLVVACLF
jgi:hypothetical protein